MKPQRNLESEGGSESNMVDKIVSESLKNPKNSYDLAICLFYMEAYDQALKALSQNDDKPSDFLKLEIYFESGQYIDTLSHTDLLLEKYSDDSNTLFAVVYIRAKCLWKLNKKHQAKKLLQELVSQNADFRDAQSILFKWNSEV